MNLLLKYFSYGQLVEIMLVGLALGVILIVVEYFRRSGHLEPEAARKSIHVVAGLLLAILPLFMLRRQIVVVNFAFFVGVLLLTGWLHIFKAVHSVKRWTIGEYLYPLATGAIAYLFSDLRIYVFAVFQLALADGFAGFYGRRFGGRGYRVIGGTKSRLGNTVFFGFSFLLSLAFILVTQVLTWPTALGYALAVALVITISEIPFSAGFDNLAVPFTSALLAYWLLSF